MSTSSSPRFCGNTKIPRFIQSPISPISSPSHTPRKFLKPKLKSFIPLKRRNDKRKYEDTLIPQFPDANNNNPTQSMSSMSATTLQLSKPISLVDLQDITFIDKPINVEVEKVRAALVGLIPPLQSSSSLERMKQKLDSSPINYSLKPIVEDVLKTLTNEDSLLDEMCPPTYSSIIEGENLHFDQNMNEIFVKKDNLVDDTKTTLGSGLSLSNRKGSGAREDTFCKGKVSWPMEFIFKHEAENSAEAFGSSENSLDDIMRKHAHHIARSSNRAKTIFSLEPQMHQSQTMLEPKKNGEPCAYSQSRVEQELTKSSSIFHEKLKVEEIRDQEVNDFFELNLDENQNQEAFQPLEKDQREKMLVEKVEPQEKMSSVKIVDDKKIDGDAKEESLFMPCRAILLKKSTVLLQRDTSFGFSKSTEFRGTFDIENSSPHHYGYVVHCNYSALAHFYVTPRKGLIEPNCITSVTIQSKWIAENSLTNELIAKDMFTIQYFPSCCNDANEIENCCHQLSKLYPDRITTQKINRIVLWDGGDFLRINDDLSKCPKSEIIQGDPIATREQLCDLYSDLILPQVRSQNLVHTVRTRMLVANREMKGSLQKFQAVKNALHILAFLSVCVPGFVLIFPFLETNVIVMEEVEIATHDTIPNEGEAQILANVLSGGIGHLYNGITWMMETLSDFIYI